MVKNKYKCDCPCHNNQNVKHVISCCVSCPECGQRIKRGMLDKHLEECGKNKLNKVTEINLRK